MSHEQTLSTITADNEYSRLQVVLSCDAAGEQTLELRQQSWGKGVGWYRQHTLQLGPGGSGGPATDFAHERPRLAEAVRTARRKGHSVSRPHAGHGSRRREDG